VTARNPETQPNPLYPESSFKYNPLMHVRVLFVRFIQGLFAAAPQGSYRWQADEANTEIFVSDESTLSPVVVERIPAVAITRGPVSFYNLGLDDLEEYDFRLDKKTKGVLLPGTITINSCARVDIESEQIAFVIADHLWLLRHLLMRAGFFDTGRGIQIGSPSRAGSIIADDRGEEFFCTPVSVPFQFARLSSYTPLGREIASSIQQRMHLQGETRQFGLGSPQNNASMSHEVPQLVHTYAPASFAPAAQDGQPSKLSIQPHPLNPSVSVQVRVVRPNRSGSQPTRPPGSLFP